MAKFGIAPDLGSGDFAGSNPVIPTTFPPEPCGFGGFFLFFFVYCGSNFDSQTSNRHGFLRGGTVSTLRRLTRFDPFLLNGYLGIHLRDQLGELFLAFLSCLCVYIFRCTLSVSIFRRVPTFE